MVCRTCDEPVLSRTVGRRQQSRLIDINYACASFIVTNIVLIVLFAMDLFSLPAMLARAYFLGIPFAVVMWRWYRLMRQTDPDYGQLWYVYWSAQCRVWGVAIYVVFLILSIAVIFHWLHAEWTS